MALDIFSAPRIGKVLLAIDWPDLPARVALVRLEAKQSEAAKPAAIEGLLRDADAAEKFIPELSERHATTAEIELLQGVLRGIKEQAK